MTEEEKKPEEEKKAEEEEKKPEDEKKSEEDNRSELDNKPTGKKEPENKSVLDTLKGITAAIEKLDSRIVKQDEKIKAMEEPTDLPLKPKLTDSEDIGDKTKVPDTYQSNSQQASIDDSDPQNSIETDPAKLSMQEKSREINKSKDVVKRATTQTSTPRPSAYQRVEKAIADGEANPNPVLADARAVGYEGLSQIARNIMKGKYYVPTEKEVPLW